MDRRQFLNTASASLFVTGFPNFALSNTNHEGRLIAIILEGGLDGLAAVPPLGDKNLRNLRKNLLLSEALKINPRISSTHYNLGLLYVHTGSLSQAEHHLKIASQLDPHSISYHFSLSSRCRS